MVEFVEDCNKVLLSSNIDEVKNVKEYVKNRFINEDSIRTHMIGYCPHNLYIPKDMRYYGSDSKNRFDNLKYIKGKLIVPIFSEFNEMIAFATRTPSTEKGNFWWNLPYPFEKRNHFYLLDKARKSIFKYNKAYLVEGYVDGIILNQYGLVNTCGIMGIALTLRKIGLLARYCENICFCFDSDENKAGEKAFKKSVATISKFNFVKNISCIEGIPIGQDPDVYMAQNGLNKFLSLERKLTHNEIKNIQKEING